MDDTTSLYMQTAVTMREELEIEVLDSSVSRLNRVIALHRNNAGALGFFPKGAFEEYARRRNIIVAIDRARDCIGYVLYRVARGRAVIVHLCVSDAARGKGVARLLVENLKHETKMLEGIGLHCRRDYDLSYLWSKLGFEAVNSKVGRGEDGAELTFWWFSHGHEDLFSRVSEPTPVRQRVVIDANVFFDLHDRNTAESDDSKALLADWVQASIELVVTKELMNEIAQASDEHLRTANRAAATRYTKLKADDLEFQRLCVDLRSAFPDSVTLRDEADLRQIAYTIAGGAPFLVTRDQTLIDRSEPLYRSHGLMVLHPAELINHLDSVEREADYRPARIEGSRLKNALLKSAELDIVVHGFKATDERANDFKKTLLRYLSRPKTTDVQLISDQANAHVLLGVTERHGQQVISVPVLRRGRHVMAGTMMRNFLRSSLAAAANEGRNVVTVSEARLSELDAAILREFGFVPCGSTWVKLTLCVIGDMDEILTSVNSVVVEPAFENAKKAAVAAIAMATRLHETAAIVAIEQQLWPVKVIAPNVPTFIVAIRPEWAQHFFDADLGSQLLFGLREDLHLGVEGVYYRKLKNNNLTAPGRVLWYVSKADGTGSMTIKACSQLVEVVEGKPKELFRRFQRLGVYEWQDVYTAADRDVTKDIVAFRFRMTERFRNPVGIESLESEGIRGPFMSPRRISHVHFASIYRKGCALT